MTPTYSKYLASLKAVLHIPAVKQLVFLLGIAGAVATGIVLFTSIKDPLYRPLDYKITQQNMSSIVDTLDKAGVNYKINDQDGVIYVAASDMQLARIKLSSAGIAKDDSFNFAYLNDQNGIGNSQFLENARYIRALESDLSRTISAIEGISSARVHIAIPQNNIFADENQRPTASIVVNMAPGLSSDKEKIRAIVQIVASSVPGLDPKDVAITDQYGHYLSGALDMNSIYNAEQLNYQNNIQNYYEKRVQSMISPIIGDNKVNVRVSANIDFTQNEEAQEKFDPEGKVIRSEQTSSEQNNTSTASGAPGALSNSPPESDSEKGGAAAAKPAGTGSGRSQSIKNYEVGKSVIYKKSNYAKVASLSVAVVVDNDVVFDPATKKNVTKPLTPEKINKITDLVKATIGYDEKRGDRVTVINSSFNTKPVGEEGEQIHFWDEPWFWDVIKKTIGIILGFVFLFILYRRMSTYMKSNAPKNQMLGHDDKEFAGQVTPEMHELKNEQINRLKELASKDPNRVALIIKNWVEK